MAAGASAVALASSLVDAPRHLEMRRRRCVARAVWPEPNASDSPLRTRAGGDVRESGHAVDAGKMQLATQVVTVPAQARREHVLTIDRQDRNSAREARQGQTRRKSGT